MTDRSKIITTTAEGSLEESPDLLWTEKAHPGSRTLPEFPALTSYDHRRQVLSGEYDTEAAFAQEVERFHLEGFVQSVRKAKHRLLIVDRYFGKLKKDRRGIHRDDRSTGFIVVELGLSGSRVAIVRILSDSIGRERFNEVKEKLNRARNRDEHDLSPGSIQ